ncbi:MAG: M3 family metallopeptidase [Enterobacteriaceae bacterium]
MKSRIKNPLLKKFLLPKFREIKPFHLIDAVEEITHKYKKFIKNVIFKKKVFTWQEIIEPIIKKNNEIDKIISTVRHLNLVKNTKFRKQYQQSISLIIELITWINQNKNLYEIYKKIIKNKKFKKLSYSKKKFLEFKINEYIKNGILLSKEKKNEFRINVNKLSILEISYENNIIDSDNCWNKLILNKKRLKGLPKSFISKNKKLNSFTNKYYWLIKLNTYNYNTIMKYCFDRKLRKEFYYFYNTRASYENKVFKNFNNSKIIKKILITKNKISKILGFKNYSCYSLKDKTINHPINAIKLIKNIYNRTFPYAKKELENLKKFSKKKLNIKNLKPWDMLFCIEKQKNELYHIKKKKIFSLKKVILTIFKILDEYYCLKIKRKKNIQVWDKTVKFFSIYSEKNRLIGGFYTDLYYRKDKIGGAWMDICSNFTKINNKKNQIPIAYINCNFSYNKKNPSIEHYEVLTLFHEIGHALHHILNKIKIPEISGINGVPFDLVEVPSQLMENYFWEKKLIYTMLDDNVKNKKIVTNNLINLRKHNYYLFLMKQIELSLIDLLIHYNISNDKIKLIIKKVNEKINIFKIPKWNNFQNTFSHIFSGGYSSCYYSYIFSGIFSSKIWKKLKNRKKLNKKNHKILIKNILSSGTKYNFLKKIKKFLNIKKCIKSIILTDNIF